MECTTKRGCKWLCLLVLQAVAVAPDKNSPHPQPGN
jgi:hypothetical protein